jgi:tRNA-dihydrouridine synthase A
MPVPRLIPEFAPQSGVMLAWPHAESDWRECLDEIEPVYLQISRVISRYEPVLIICYDEEHVHHVTRLLVQSGVTIDDRDSYEELAHFIDRVQQGGCGMFIIHARKAFLQGLSPKENRTVPPLNYDYAYRIKQQYPELSIIINGGISDLDAAERHLMAVDGVMLGRSAYHNPYLLAEVDRRLFQTRDPVPTREEIVYRMLPYIERELNQGSPLKHITRHMLGLFQGIPGARHWRRHLSEYGPRAGASTSAGIEVVTQALGKITATENIISTTRHNYQSHG